MFFLENQWYTPSTELAYGFFAFVFREKRKKYTPFLKSWSVSAHDLG